MSSSPVDPYPLTLSAPLQVAGETPVAPTRLIQRQMKQGFARLRFEPALEHDFHAYLRNSSRLSRAALIFLAVAGTLLSALLDVHWLGLPHDLLLETRLIQFTVMMPMALICTYLCLRRPTSRAMASWMRVSSSTCRWSW